MTHKYESCEICLASSRFVTRRVMMMFIWRSKGKSQPQVWEVGCETYVTLTLDLPLVVCPAMRQNPASVLARKRLESGCLGRLWYPRISSQAWKTNKTASKLLSPRESSFLPAMPLLSLISRRPAREDAEEQGIDIEEMDRIDRKMDRQALLNMTS